MRGIIFPVLCLCFAISSIAQPKLVYNGTPSIQGTPGQEGTVYNWPNVGTINGLTIGSKITILSITGGAILKNIDDNSYGYDDAWQPIINGPVTPSGSCWGIEFEISFYNSNTLYPFNIDMLRINGLDIDGDNQHLREYNTFTDPYSYTVESDTYVTATTNNNSVTFTSSKVDWVGIDIDNTGIRTSVNYFNSNSVRVKLGSCCSGGKCSATGQSRLHSLYFGDPGPYVNPILTIIGGGGALPLSLTSFTVARKNQVLALAWNSENETEVQHFVIEQSCDGVLFHGVKQIPARNEATNTYFFELPDTVGCAQLYFRLKCVDKSGKFIYSKVCRLTNNKEEHTIALSYTNGYLMVTWPATNSIAAVLKVTDCQGRTISMTNIELKPGVNRLSLNSVQRRTTGTYVIQVLTPNTTSFLKMTMIP